MQDPPPTAHGTALYHCTKLYNNTLHYTALHSTVSTVMKLVRNKDLLLAHCSIYTVHCTLPTAH